LPPAGQGMARERHEIGCAQDESMSSIEIGHPVLATFELRNYNLSM